MICTDAREYLFAFLDNELDAHLSIEVQRHLEHCPGCAQQAEIEREIGKHLTTELQGDSVAPTLDEAAVEGMLALRRASPIAGRPVFSRRHVLRLSGLAAAVMLVLLAWWAGRGATLVDHDKPGLAELVVEDYQQFLENGRHVQLVSADAGEVSRWLRGQTGLEVSIATMTGHRCKLVGARKCELAGRPAAFALYEMKGTPVSLLATARAGIGMGRMRRVADQDEEFWTDQCNGHTVVAKRQGKLVYAAVSTLPQNDLIHLIESAVHESD